LIENQKKLTMVDTLETLDMQGIDLANLSSEDEEETLLNDPLLRSLSIKKAKSYQQGPKISTTLQHMN